MPEPTEENSLPSAASFILRGGAPVLPEAANQADFRVAPLTTAIDELSDELLSEVAARASDRAGVTLDQAALVEWIFVICDPPPDRPDPLDGAKGLTKAVGALAQVFGRGAPLHRALEALRPSLVLRFGAQAPHRRPLMGRRLRYPAYDVCLALVAQWADQTPTLAAIAAAEFIVAWLNGRAPDRALARQIQDQLAHLAKSSATSTAKAPYSKAAQAKRLQRAIRELGAACHEHSDAASTIGMAAACDPADTPDADPVLAFNADLGDRWRSCSDYLPERDRQGVFGHGTLTPQLVREAGRLLRSGIEAGDDVALLELFEVLLNVTAKLAREILVVQNDEHSDAWLVLELDRGTVRISLEWLLAQAAVPDAHTVHLYEHTARTCRLVLPPFAVRALRLKGRDVTRGSMTRLGHILRGADHHPKSCLIGVSSPYAITVHRLRQSLPALLLQQGHSRMVSGLLLSQFGLVSRGRAFYGMVREEHLHPARAALYQGLDWLSAGERLTSEIQLVGSLVVSTPESIELSMSSLARDAERADLEHRASGTLSSWVRRHRCIAAYVAFVLEFCLCLRGSSVYDMAACELAKVGAPVHVDDKRVRQLGGGAPVAKPAFLERVLCGWMAHLALAAADPALDGSDAGVRIRAHCRNTLATDATAPSLVFDVDVHGDRLEVGHETWRGALPPDLRLVKNFGRQFWPCRMEDRGLGQWFQDYLLRHQIHGVEHDTNQDPVPNSRIHVDLIAAMDAFIATMDLPLPEILKIGEVIA